MKARLRPIKKKHHSADEFIEAMRQRNPSLDGLWRSTEFRQIVESLRTLPNGAKKIARIANALTFGPQVVKQSVAAQADEPPLAEISNLLKRLDALTKPLITRYRPISRVRLPQAFYDLRRQVQSLRVEFEKLRNGKWKLDRISHSWSDAMERPPTKEQFEAMSSPMRVEDIGLDSSKIGASGKGRTKPESAVVGFVSASVASELPRPLKGNFALIARLLSLAGTPCTKYLVRRALQSRDTTRKK